jgi:hypothetical protein
MKDQLWKTKMAASTVGIRVSISLVKGIIERQSEHIGFLNSNVFLLSCFLSLKFLSR